MTNKDYQVAINSIKEQKALEELQKVKEKFVKDAQLSWGEIKPGQKEVYVYRSGLPKSLHLSERNHEAQSYELADAVIPEGRTGRVNGFLQHQVLVGWPVGYRLIQVLEKVL